MPAGSQTSPLTVEFILQYQLSPGLSGLFPPPRSFFAILVWKGPDAGDALLRQMSPSCFSPSFRTELTSVEAFVFPRRPFVSPTIFSSLPSPYSFRGFLSSIPPVSILSLKKNHKEFPLGRQSFFLLSRSFRHSSPNQISHQPDQRPA